MDSRRSQFGEFWRLRSLGWWSWRRLPPAKFHTFEAYWSTCFAKLAISVDFRLCSTCHPSLRRLTNLVPFPFKSWLFTFQVRFLLLFVQVFVHCYAYLYQGRTINTYYLRNGGFIKKGCFHLLINLVIFLIDSSSCLVYHLLVSCLTHPARVNHLHLNTIEGLLLIHLLLLSGSLKLHFSALISSLVW